MKISMILHYYMTGTTYANIHYLRSATFQLDVSENNDVIVFPCEFIDTLNSSPLLRRDLIFLLFFLCWTTC